MSRSSAAPPLRVRLSVTVTACPAARPALAPPSVTGFAAALWPFFLRAETVSVAVSATVAARSHTTRVLRKRFRRFSWMAGMRAVQLAAVPPLELAPKPVAAADWVWPAEPSVPLAEVGDADALPDELGSPVSLVMRPMRLPSRSVNHRATSGPAAIPDGLPRTGNSVITPTGVIRPMRFVSGSVNQRFPSEPIAMPPPGSARPRGGVLHAPELRGPGGFLRPNGGA